MQNPKGVAQEFNNYFTSFGANLSKKIPNTEKLFQDFLTSYNKKIHFVELESDAFEKALKSLKKSKATGFDDLSSNIIIDT